MNNKTLSNKQKTLLNDTDTTYMEEQVLIDILKNLYGQNLTNQKYKKKEDENTDAFTVHYLIMY